MIENYLTKKAKGRVKVASDRENPDIRILSSKERDETDALVWVEQGRTSADHLARLIADLFPE